jgi:hypothetical protein
VENHSEETIEHFGSTVFLIIGAFWKYRFLDNYNLAGHLSSEVKLEG